MCWWLACGAVVLALAGWGIVAMLCLMFIAEAFDDMP